MELGAHVGWNPVYPQSDQGCYFIAGTHGSLSIPRLELWRNAASVAGGSPSKVSRDVVVRADPLRLQIEQFCQVIPGHEPPLVSGREGLMTLKVIAAVQEAAASGQTLTLPELEDSSRRADFCSLFRTARGVGSRHCSKFLPGPAPCSKIHPRHAPHAISNGTRACRHDAFAVQRDSEALYLTQGHVYGQCGGLRGAFRRRRSGFIYARFPIRQWRCSSSAWPRRRCRKRPCHGLRHGGGHGHVMGLVRAGDHLWQGAPCSDPAAMSSRIICRFRCRDDACRWHGHRRMAGCVRPNTKAFFLESPANPTLEVIDIAAVAAIARQGRRELVVDNVFATPLWQRPLALAPIAWSFGD